MNYSIKLEVSKVSSRLAGCRRIELEKDKGSRLMMTFIKYLQKCD